MAFTLASRTITQTGVENPQALLEWAAVNAPDLVSGSVEGKFCKIEDGVLLIIDGEWNDSYWTYDTGLSTRLQIGNNGIWTSGEYDPNYNKPIGGYKRNFDSWGHDGGGKFNYGTGGEINWIGVEWIPKSPIRYGRDASGITSYRSEFIINSAAVKVSIKNSNLFCTGYFYFTTGENFLIEDSVLGGGSVNTIRGDVSKIKNCQFYGSTTGYGITISPDQVLDKAIFAIKNGMRPKFRIFTARNGAAKSTSKYWYRNFIIPEKYQVADGAYDGWDPATFWTHAFDDLDQQGGNNKFYMDFVGGHFYFDRDFSLKVTDSGSNAAINDGAVYIENADHDQNEILHKTYGIDEIPNLLNVVYMSGNDGKKANKFLDLSHKNIKAITYAHLPNSKPINMAFDAAHEEIILSADGLITQPDKAITDAYTTIDSAAQFYDRAKSYLVDHYAGEGAPIVTREGGTIDAGALNIVVDRTASATFALTDDTVTIKSDTFSGNLKTAGTVTLANGATINGGIIDATGNSFLRFDGIDSWAVYTSAADRDAGISAIGAGSSGDIHRFNFTANTPFYLRLTLSGETLFKEFSATGAGETPITLNTAAQLAVLAKDVISARDHARGANAQTKG